MFEEGAKLLKECQQELEQAEKRIDGIRLEDSADGSEN